MMYAENLALAICDGLQNITEIFIGEIDIQIFNGLKQRAVFRSSKNYFGPRDHQFVAFASHLLHEDGNLHFAASMDLKCACGFGVVDLKRNVPLCFSNQPLANMSRSHEFSFAPCKRRIVNENMHANRRRIDVDELKRLALLAIRQRFADGNVLTASKPNDVAGSRLFYFDLL